MHSPAIFDALIVGGGPAGLSAALALGRINRTALVFDSGEYRNAGVRAMHTVLSRDGEDPAEFRDIAHKQMHKYPTIQFCTGQIEQAANIDIGSGYMGYQLVDSKNATYRGRKLILATGTEDVLPTNIEGYKENWPSHIYQCLYCDGFEKKGQPIGILEFSNPGYAGLSIMATHLSDNVTIYTNGPAKTDDAVQKAIRTAQASGVHLDNRPIRRLINQGDDIGVEFEDGQKISLGLLVHKPPTVNRSQKLIDQLGLKHIDNTTEVLVNPLFTESSLPGCFVPGDAGQLLKQVAVAMGTGVRAASGASFQLCNEEGARNLAAAEANGHAKAEL
ncbi:GliT [[Torrubiella] hemipterigena]|uniref:GliT n=1 Tax=[Torrubiella] hemipterigena TaxID=1531966 RepID=A0A0A1TAC8_9HYPO|nr:GliT [[Torrubiella] hemipterigena]